MLSAEAIFVCIYFQLKVILTMKSNGYSPHDFELIDQQVEKKNICKKRPPPYQDALTSSTCAIDFGYEEFVSHDTLKSRCYIKNNAICIKLHVHLKIGVDHD